MKPDELESAPVGPDPTLTTTPNGAPARPPGASRSVRAICLAVLAIQLAHLCVFGYLAIRKRGPDFEYFYKAGHWLFETGSLDPGYDRLADGSLERRGTIDWYLPFVSRLMSLVGWLPMRAAGVICLIGNVIALLGTMGLLARYVSGLPPRDWFVTLTLPLLLLSMFWHWEFRLNQINNLALLLMVGSFVAWRKGHESAAGLWIGLAALIKITPALLLAWFVLKRANRTAAVGLLTIVLAGPVSDMIVLGPATATQAYVSWAERAVSRSSHRGLIASQTEMDWRNQGLGAVLSRWLHPTSYALRFDNDPRIQTQKPAAYVNVMELPRETVATLTNALLAASLLGLFWLTRRPAAGLSEWQLRIEWTLYLLAMLWMMPVLRRYHLIWMTPAVVVFQSMLYFHWHVRWWRWAGVGAIGVVTAAQFAALTRLLDTDVVEGAGVFLASLVVLGMTGVVLLMAERRGALREAAPRATRAPARGSADARAAGAIGAPDG